MRELLTAAAVTLLALTAAFAGTPVATGSEEDEEAAFLESHFDGVWVGSVAVKTDDGIRQRPLLVNLDVGSDSVAGVALAADSWTGAPSAIEAQPLIDGTTRNRKVTFSLPAGGETALRPLARNGESYDFVFRLRRGRLKGKMKSDAQGIAGVSRAELFPLDEESDLQQFWLGELDGAGAAPAAGVGAAIVLLGSGRSLTGVGLLGDLAGTIRGSESETGDIELTLTTDDGPVALALRSRRKELVGEATGALSADLTLAPGGVAKRTKLRRAKPRDLPVGSATEVTLRGRNLPEGTMVHIDNPGVRASAPMLSGGRLAALRLIVDEAVEVGTTLRLRLLLPNGDTIDARRPLLATEGRDVSFSLDLQPVFSSTCALAGCHVEPDDDDPAYGGDASAAGNLILEMGRAYGNLVNIPSSEVPSLMRVEPGNPDDSYLIRKLRGEGIEGGRMPLGGPYLTDEMIDMFVRWIEAGAENG